MEKMGNGLSFSALDTELNSLILVSSGEYKWLTD